jgi:hypothetical protein
MASMDRSSQTNAGSGIRRDDPVVITDPTHSSEASRTKPAAQGPRHRSGDPEVVEEQRIVPAKTSTMAVLALVIGLTALYAFLSVILSPLGLVLAVVGMLLGIGGIRRAREQGVTGKYVAVSGFVLSSIALIGSIVLAAGVATFLNDDAAVQRLENSVQELRDDLPEEVDIPQP